MENKNSVSPNNASKIFNASPVDDEKNNQRNAPPGTNGGVDHTLTPGENPVPDDDQNKDVEWNKNEKVSDEKKIYVNNQVNSLDDLDDEIDNEDKTEESAI